jgi:MFS family permease
MDTTASTLGARLERLPLSQWHWRMLGVLGLAWAFDGLDSTIIGAIAAALSREWHLSPATLGFLLSSNLAGTVIGALLASMGDRFGRKTIFQWSLLWFSLPSLVCAFAWSVHSLIFLRFLMGFGLGAELPIIASYMGELVPAAARGRTQGLLNTFWPIGAILAALIALIVIPLFRNGAAKRTVMLWGLLFFGYIGNAGLLGWMPSLFTNAGFSLSKSFAYVLIMQVAYVPNQFLGAWLMDRVGRRFVLIANGLLSAVAGMVYGYVLINHADAWVILLMGIIVAFFVSAMFARSTSMVRSNIQPRCAPPVTARLASSAISALRWGRSSLASCYRPSVCSVCSP